MVADKGNDPYIYGIRPLSEALDSGRLPEKVLLRKGLQGSLFQALQNKLRRARVPCQYVPVEKLNRLVRGNHQGVVAFMPLIEYQDLESLLPGIFERGETPLLVLVEGVTDVRNLGAIARAAVCAGAHALVFPERHSAPVNADAVKVSAGAFAHLPVCKSRALTETIAFLKAAGLQVLALDDKAGMSIYQAELDRPLAILLGAEDKGLSKLTRTMADQMASIPMKGAISSLNVSVAAGVVLFETLRQREWNGKHRHTSRS